MFEDSTFESGSRIKTKSGRWMLVTGSINAAILILLILIPLHLSRGAAIGTDGNNIDAAAPSATTSSATAAA